MCRGGKTLATALRPAHPAAMSGPEDILPTYERVGPAYAAQRDRSLFERHWLDRILAEAPGQPQVLDIGCGGGAPIATYLTEQGAKVTGVDGAAAMVAVFRETLPAATAHVADMRRLDLGQQFDAVIAINSFFHLSPDDQRAMFPIFAAHLRPHGLLWFTSGPEAGERIGAVEGAPVYHSSLDPAEFRELMAANGLQVLTYAPEDPQTRGHTLWLARKAG